MSPRRSRVAIPRRWPPSSACGPSCGRASRAGPPTCASRTCCSRSRSCSPRSSAMSTRRNSRPRRSHHGNVHPDHLVAARLLRARAVRRGRTRRGRAARRRGRHSLASHPRVRRRRDRRAVRSTPAWTRAALRWPRAAATLARLHRRPRTSRARSRVPGQPGVLAHAARDLSLPSLALGALASARRVARAPRALSHRPRPGGCTRSGTS